MPHASPAVARSFDCEDGSSRVTVRSKTSCAVAALTWRHLRCGIGSCNHDGAGIGLARDPEISTRHRRGILPPRLHTTMRSGARTCEISHATSQSVSP